MRAVSPAWALAIPFSHAIVTKVNSYRDGQLLASEIPIETGTMRFDDTGVLKRRLTLTVPARDGFSRWDPGDDPYAPLNAYGQRLHVWTGIAHSGITELLDLGELLITGWARDEPNGVVTVEALDLATLVVDKKIPVPTTPPAGSSFFTEFSRLVTACGLVAVLDPGLTNRGIGNNSVVYDGDRDKAIDELMNAWPARWYVGDDGKAHAAAPYSAVTTSTQPLFTITDGSVGTVTGRARSAQRGAIFNAVAVLGKAPDDGVGAQPYKLARITDPGSPIRADGPYGEVTRQYQSDLITTQAQADATAAAMLARYSTAGRSEKLTSIPDPSIQLGDVGRAYTRDGDTYIGRVTTMDLPLTAADGEMAISLSNEPGEGN